MTHPAPAPFLLDQTSLSAEESDAVLHGALLAPADVASVDVAGPGAIACLQGLFTNDVEKPGDHAFVYGAVLTPKGMIVSDAWLARNGPRATLFLPRAGLGDVQSLFERALPPRLARSTDRTGRVSVLRLVGPAAPEVIERAGVALPGKGRSGTAIVRAVACEVAQPPDGAPFALQLTVAGDDAAVLVATLVDAGARVGSEDGVELARIFAGWPRLGAEIDGKTLPQEVRFDEHDGVSYTKGCYTGQETVARVHFRGHPNRRLVGISWDDAPDPQQADVIQDGKPRGRVSSIAWVAPLERFLGLAIVRRELDAGQRLLAAGAPADLVALPFTLDE